MNGQLNKQSLSSSVIPLLITCIIVSAVILIPFKVMGYGFLPLDDALRHVGKVISGKGWKDIIVMRKGMSFDDHPGYHALLDAFYHATKCTPDGLLSFSVIFLFAAFCLAPVLLLKRPEAWIAALFIITITNFSFIARLLIGRPYITAMAAIVILFCVWARLKDNERPYGTMILITVAMALATWIHCSWYLLILPIACFLIAGERRVALLAGVCTLTGIASGILLTGHPINFLRENMIHAFLVFNNHPLPRTLTQELRPFTGDPITVIAALLLLLWRRERGKWDIKWVVDPVFIFAAIGWILGFFVQRFWLDLGLPALLVWMAQQLEDMFGKAFSPVSSGRFILAVVISVLLYMNITNDVNDRWSNNPMAEYLYSKDHDQASWMPEDGGIIYSDDLRAFFITFFKYPHGNWRYLVGFEPGLMPQDDLGVFTNIQMAQCSPESFYPWIRKMKPADRLMITPESGKEPQIPELEWHYAGSGFWIGRRHN